MIATKVFIRCPRCGARVFVEADHHGPYLDCISCGKIIDLKAKPRKLPWFKEVCKALTAGDCPECHSHFVSRSGNSQTKVVSNHCSKCGHDWEG